ncbi:MAG TPA: hypothetical protein VH054_07210, partial [Polyangiaceae bacterium]|nr:hypothetical protein [Polyangiaceae bacterium]
LLIVPQSVTAIVLKFSIPHILARFGYRGVLMANTIAMGSVMALFAMIGHATPLWLILATSAAFGFFSSLQYTSMNTLAYADVEDSSASMASTIASTMQQMSMSFGIATASLATVLFIPRTTSASDPMISGVHKAFIALGTLTVLSALVFTRLRRSDGDNVAHHSEAI